MKNAFLFILSLLLLSKLDPSLAASSNYDLGYFNLHNEVIESDLKEISAFNTYINGTSKGRNLSITADTVTINAGSYLDFEQIQIDCKRLIINGGTLRTKINLKINADRFKGKNFKLESPNLLLTVQDFYQMDKTSGIAADHFIAKLGTEGFYGTFSFAGSIRPLSTDQTKISVNKDFVCALYSETSCIDVRGPGKGLIKIDTDISGFSSLKVESANAGKETIIAGEKFYGPSVELNGQLKDISSIDLKAQELNINHSLSSEKLCLDGVSKLRIAEAAKIKANKADIIAGDLDLNGSLDVDDLDIFFTMHLHMPRLALNGREARIHGSGKLALDFLSVLQLSEALNLDSKSSIDISGETFSELLSLSAQYDVKTSGKQTAKEISLLSEQSLVEMSGLVDLKEAGSMSISGKNAKLENLTIAGPQNTKAKSLEIQAQRDLQLKDTKVSNISQASMKAGKTLSIDEASKIDVDMLRVDAPEMVLNGKFRAKSITVHGNRVKVGGRMVDVNEVNFFTKEELNIGTYAALHVLHRLNIKSDNKVSISGEVVAQVLDVAAPELVLLSKGKLEVTQQAAIYTSLWLKLNGVIDFSRADTKIVASGTIDLNTVLKYKNLEIRKAQTADANQTPGQKLLLKIRENAALEHTKAPFLSWAEENPDKLESDFYHAGVEQLNDDEAFAELLADELSKPHWSSFEGLQKVLLFLWSSMVDSVKQSLFSGALDLTKDGLKAAGIKSLGHLKDSLFSTIGKMSSGDISGLSWGSMGGFLTGAAGRAFKDLSGGGFSPESYKDAFKCLGHVALHQGKQQVIGNIFDPTRITLDVIQLLFAYPNLSRPQFIKRTADLVGGSSIIKSTILHLIGYQEKAEQLMSASKKLERIAGPKNLDAPDTPEFEDGHLKIEADDLLINGVVDANNLKTNSSLYSQSGQVHAKVAEIISEHVQLHESGTLSIEDKAKIQANIDVILAGQLQGGKPSLQSTASGSVAMDPSLKDTFIEINAKKILSTGKLRVNGSLRLKAEGEDGLVIIKDGSVKACEFSVDAANARISVPVEAENAFYNVYNELVFDSMDEHIVKNYLKIHAPNAKVKISSKMIAKVIDMASEEFYLMRSGLLSAKEHAILETKAHMLLEGVIEAENAELSAKSIDFKGTQAKIKDSLRVSAKNIKAWKHANLDTNSAYFDADGGSFDIEDSTILAQKVMDIKAKHFKAILGASIKGDSDLSIRATNAYVGELTKIKASRINLKSWNFMQAWWSSLEANDINLDSDLITSAGLMMAENIVASSRLTTLGGTGRMLGGTVSISSDGLVMAPVSLIAGGRVNVATRVNTTLTPGSAIVGGQVNVRSLSLLLAPGTAIVGAKTSVVAPLFLAAPFSLVGGAFGANVNCLYANQRANAAVGSISGNAKIDTFDGHIDGYVVELDEEQKWEEIKKRLNPLSIFRQEKESQGTSGEEKSTEGENKSGNDGQQTEENQKESTDKDKNNDKERIPTVSTGIAALGALHLGKNARIRGSNAGVSAHSFHAASGGEISGKHAQILIAGLAKIDATVQAKDSLIVQGLSKEAKVLLKKDAKLKSEKLLGIQNLAEMEIADRSSHGDAGTAALETAKGLVKVDTFRTHGGKWLDIDPGQEEGTTEDQKTGLSLYARNLAIQGKHGRTAEAKEDGTKPASTIRFQQTGKGSFTYGGQAGDGINTELSSEAKIKFQSTDQTQEIGSGESLVVDARNGAHIAEGERVTSRSTKIFLADGSLDIDGRLGAKGSSTQIKGLSSDQSQGEEESSLSETPEAGNLQLGKLGRIEGHLDVQDTENSQLDGTLDLDQNSKIKSRSLRTGKTFQANLDARHGEVNLDLEAQEMSLLGKAATEGTNKTKLTATQKNGKSDMEFGLHHEENEQTEIRLESDRRVKFADSGEVVGGGEKFSVKSQGLDAGNAKQEAKKQLEYEFSADTNLSGNLSSQDVTIKGDSNVHFDDVQVDLRDEGGKLSVETKGASGNLSVGNASDASVSLGDDDPCNSKTKAVSLDKLEVNGNSETKTVVTATDLVELDNASVQGDLSANANDGVASLQNSNVDGDVQVYGKKETLVKGNSLAGNKRIGYRTLFDIDEEGEAHIQRSKHTEFTDNTNSPNDDSDQKLSILGDKVVTGGNQGFEASSEVSIIADRKEQATDDSLQSAQQYNELVKVYESEKKGDTHNQVAMNPLSLDRNGHYTSQQLTEAEIEHNDNIRRVVKTIHEGFAANKKTLMSSNLGLTALVEAMDGDVELVEDLTPGLDLVKIYGKRFLIPKHRTLETLHFVSYARQNEILGRLLHEQTAIFIGQNGSQGEKTFFGQGSQIGQNDTSDTFVRTEELDIGGDVQGNSLRTETQRTIYRETADRTLHTEENNAEASLEDHGKRKAHKVVDQSDGSIRYGKTYKTEITEGGSFTRIAPQITSERQGKTHLGEGASLTLGGPNNNGQAQLSKAEKIELKEEIKGDFGSSLSITSDELGLKGLIDLDKAVLIADRLEVEAETSEQGLAVRNLRAKLDQLKASGDKWLTLKPTYEKFNEDGTREIGLSIADLDANNIDVSGTYAVADYDSEEREKNTPDTKTLFVVKISQQGEGRFQYAANAEDGIETQLISDSRIEFDSHGNKQIVGGGSQLSVHSKKGASIAPSTTVSSKDSSWYLSGGELEILGQLGQSGDSTRLYGVSEESVTKLTSRNNADSSENQKANLRLAQTGTLKGQIQGSFLGETQLDGSLSVDKNSQILSDKISSSETFEVELDARNNKTRLDLVGREVSLHGHGQTHGTNAAAIVAHQTDPSKELSMSYLHSEDAVTTVEIQTPGKVSLKQNQSVGGGDSFLVKSDSVDMNSAHQTARTNIQFDMQSDATVNGSASAKSIKYSSKKGKLDTDRGFEADLRGEQGDLTLEGTEVSATGVVKNAGGAKVILGDRNALQSRTKKVAVDNLKVEGNAETHTSATAQDSADVKSSSFSGSLDVTSTSGTAKLEKSNVDGDASVYGPESTTVSNNTFGGSQRVGYQAVLKDEKVELRKSKSTKFTRNKNAAKNKASQKVSIFGENVSHSQNRDYADTGEVSILADRRTTLGGDSLRKARQLNEDTKTDISAQNGNTHNLMGMKSLSLDQHGNFTSKNLSQADLDHNREMARLANMLRVGFSGAEKTLMPTKLGITAYISGDNAEGVKVCQDILPGIDQIRVDGKNFYLPEHLTLRVANFASFAKKNEIRGKLLHKQMAIFMAEDGGETEETYFAEGSQVGEGDSTTEVVSKNIKIAGKARGKSLVTQGQDIEYLESADRQLEVEVNTARNSLEDYGRRTALKALDSSEKSIKYSTSHHTSILDDGIMSISAPSVKLEGNETSEDKRFSLGKNAHLTIGGGLSSTDDENANILPSRNISIKGSIHGDEGSKITLVSEYLDNKGLVDAGEVLAIAERITLNGTFEGNEVSVNTDWLKGLGTIKAHSKLRTSIGEDWAPGKGGSLKLESGGDLEIRLPHNNPNQFYRPTRLDLEHVHAGGVLYIAGALDSQYVRQLMTGSLGMNRSNNVSAKKLHIKTSDPVVMIDRNIKVEFEDSELECNNFVMNKDAVLETNHFRLDAINLIQKSGAIIDSGKDHHNISIDVQNMFQVYDFDGYAEPDDKIKYNLNELGIPQDFKPAEIRAGGELNIFAHNKVDPDNPEVKGHIFSLGGQFISRHENILMKSEGSIYIVPITKIQRSEIGKPSEGKCLNWKYKRIHWEDKYEVYREKLITRALFRSAKNVSIEAESGELLDVRLSRQAKTNLSRGTKNLIREENKLGSGPSPIGQGLIMGVKVGATVAAGYFFGPGTAAKLYTALSTATFNTAIDISINRSSGGLRTKDEWRIARNNLKNGAISFGTNFMYDGLSDKFGDSLKQSALNATEGLKYSAEMMQYAEVIVETVTKNVFREGLSALLDQRSMNWDSLLSQTPDDILDSVIALGIGKLTGEVVNNADLQLDDAFSIGAKHVIDDMLADVAGHLARNENVHTDQILQRALDSSINELANVVGSTIGQKLKENKDALDKESPIDRAFEKDERFQQLVADTESILNMEAPADSVDSQLPTIPEEENEDQIGIDDSGNDIEPGQSDLKLDAEDYQSNRNHEIEPAPGLKEAPNPEENLQNEQPSSPVGMTEEDHEFQAKLKKEKEKVEQLEKNLAYIEESKTCFSPDTWILTPQGSLKAIGDVEEGDLVLSCNFKHCQEAKVTRVHHFELKEVLDLKTSVGTFTVTPDHPIYHISDPEDICEENAKIKDAELFKSGDHLLTASFDLAQVSSAIGEKRRYSPVVELSIEKNHNFYVIAPDSDLKQDVYSRAILVHNCGGDEELIHPAKNLDELGDYTDGQKDGYEFAFDVYTNLPSGAGVVVAAKELGKKGAKEAAKKAGKELAKKGARDAEREAGKKVVEHVKDHKKKVDAGDSNAGAKYKLGDRTGNGPRNIATHEIHKKDLKIQEQLGPKGPSDGVDIGNLKYHDRVRARGVQDPSAHNFPYSFDREIIQNSTPVLRKDGALQYNMKGSMLGSKGTKDGVFEITINPDTGIIFHRNFRPNK